MTQDHGRPLEPVHPRPDQLQQREVGGEHQRRKREVGAGAIVYEGGVEAKGAGAAHRDGRVGKPREISEYIVSSAVQDSGLGEDLGEVDEEFLQHRVAGLDQVAAMGRALPVL